MQNTPERLRIVPAMFYAGWELEIDGEVQSHVDLAEPELLRFEYLRRIGNIFDACWPAAAPITALHLGAGALTLPRYLQATRPGSEQTVVELDPELLPLVHHQLPLPEGTRLTTLIGDARAIVETLTGQVFDAIILDIFTGSDTAPHLTGEAFYRNLLELLSPTGVLIVNIGDDDGLPFLDNQYRALQAAARQHQYASPWILGDATTLLHRRAGNIVLADGPGLPTQPEGIAALRTRLLAAGPYPAAVRCPTNS